jgi:hypothetical protein
MAEQIRLEYLANADRFTDMVFRVLAIDRHCKWNLIDAASETGDFNQFIASNGLVNLFKNWKRSFEAALSAQS